jgi:hypothetical protein
MMPDPLFSNLLPLPSFSGMFSITRFALYAALISDAREDFSDTMEIRRREYRTPSTQRLGRG